MTSLTNEINEDGPKYCHASSERSVWVVPCVCIFSLLPLMDETSDLWTNSKTKSQDAILSFTYKVHALKTSYSSVRLSEGWITTTAIVMFKQDWALWSTTHFWQPSFTSTESQSPPRFWLKAYSISFLIILQNKVNIPDNCQNIFLWCRLNPAAGGSVYAHI